MEPTKKIGRAGALLLFRKIWSISVNLLVMGILARYVSKTDFGIVAICNVLVSLFSVLSSVGIGEFLIIYKGGDSKSIYNQAFTINVVLVLIMNILLVFSFYWWSTFYGDDKIIEIGLILAFSFFGDMLTVIPKSILRKELKYDILVFYLTVFGTLTSISKLILVFLGFGIYSIVLPMAFFSIILAIVLIIKLKLKLTLTIERSFLKDLFRFSKPMFGSNVLTYFVNEGDTIIVGKLLGMEVLGIYNIAFNVSNIFQNNLLPIITDISLPAFATISNNIELLRKHYFKMIKLITFISFLILTMMITHSRFIIQILYGANWTEAILPLQILLLFTISRSISSPTSGLFNATNNVKLAFRISLVFTPIFIISVYIGSYFGLIGVCLGVTISRMSGALISIRISLKLLKTNLANLYSSISPIIYISIIHSFIAFMLITIVGYSTFNEIVFMLIQVVIIFLLLYFVFNKYFSEILKDIETLFPRIKPLFKYLVRNNIA